jgi:Polyketide cyclase / dehydrase and lipid transport
MLDMTLERVVHSSPEDAFGFVAERFFENHHRWDPAVTMERDGDGPIAVGTTGRETRRFMGRQTAGVRVTALERPGWFAFATTSGPFALERSYAFAPAPEGSTITFRFRMRPKPLPLRAAFPLVRGRIAHQVEANIDRLAALLDGAAPAPGSGGAPPHEGWSGALAQSRCDPE